MVRTVVVMLMGVGYMRTRSEFDLGHVGVVVVDVPREV